LASHYKRQQCGLLRRVLSWCGLYVCFSVTLMHPAKAMRSQIVCSCQPKSLEQLASCAASRWGLRTVQSATKDICL